MSSDAQQTNNTSQIGLNHSSDLVENIGKKLYLNAKTADVHFSFVAEDGLVLRVPAHKSVLAAGSDVFEAMFYGSLKGKGIIEVTDVSEAAFIEFLQFFYLPKVKLTMENIAGVMHLSHKYNVPTCVNVCVEFLKEVLTIDNLFIGLNLAILHDHQELKKICDTFIMLNTTEVLKTNGFLKCNQQMLEHILNMSVLSCSEVDIFKACMAWVRTKSKQNTLTKALVEEHLGDLYYEIRFKSMTVQELCSVQMEYEAVLRDDFAIITNMIANPEFQAKKFNNQPRHAKCNTNAIIKCDRSIDTEQKSYVIAAERKTTFSTNKPLLLGSFMCAKIGLYQSCYRDLRSELLINIEILENDDLDGTNSRIVLKMKAKLQSKDTNVALLHPILIRPGFFYEVCVGPFPDDHGYYSKELKSEVQLHSDVMIKFYKCNVDFKNEKIIGLIPVLNFNSI